MEPSWQRSSCMTRSTPSNMPSSRPLPSPRGLWESEDRSGLSKDQARMAKTVKPWRTGGQVRKGAVDVYQPSELQLQPNPPLCIWACPPNSRAFPSTSYFKVMSTLVSLGGGRGGIWGQERERESCACCLLLLLVLSSWEWGKPLIVLV